MKTPMAKSGEVQPSWYLVDAEREVLGRAAVKIARILQGKNKPTWTPHVDTGDFVVVINGAKIQATGAKDTDKEYDWYTGWAGGRKTRSLAQMRERSPEKILRLAVRRMLPKTKLGRKMLKKLKIFPGPTHEHAAQQPEVLDLGTGRTA